MPCLDLEEADRCDFCEAILQRKQDLDRMYSEQEQEYADER